MHDRRVAAGDLATTEARSVFAYGSVSGGRRSTHAASVYKAFDGCRNAWVPDNRERSGGTFLPMGAPDLV